MSFQPSTPPSCGPQPPSLTTILASLCAAVCIGAVVWSIYAAFGQQIFDLQQAVLQPLGEWAAAPHAVASVPDVHAATHVAVHALPPQGVPR